jgi:hypothetical protein
MKYLNPEYAICVLYLLGLSGFIYYNIPVFISWLFPLCDCGIR